MSSDDEDFEADLQAAQQQMKQKAAKNSNNNISTSKEQNTFIDHSTK